MKNFVYLGCSPRTFSYTDREGVLRECVQVYFAEETEKGFVPCLRFVKEAKAFRFYSMNADYFAKEYGSLKPLTPIFVSFYDDGGLRKMTPKNE